MSDFGAKPTGDDGKGDGRRLDTKALERAFSELSKTLDKGKVDVGKILAAQRAAAEATAAQVVNGLPAPPSVSDLIELHSLDALSDTVEQLEKLPEQMTSNFTEVGAALDELEAAIDRFDEVPALYASFTERQVSSANALLEKLEELSEQVLTGFPDELDTLSEAMEEVVATEAAALNDTLLEGTRETIGSALKDIEGLTQQAASVLTNIAKGMLDRLGDRAKEIVEKELGGAIQDFAQETVLDALTEIGAGMMITQLSAQVTTALSAQLPQLIIAKNAVGAVRRLLEIARAGI